MPSSEPSPPLFTNVYIADPSAHVFMGKLFIYPSHDRETDIKFNDNGDQYDMADASCALLIKLVRFERGKKIIGSHILPFRFNLNHV
jgi:hypothetical protein